MRLIDADALKKDIARLHILNDEAEIRKAYASNPYSTLSDFEDTLVSVFDDIDEAPTIEPKTKVIAPITFDDDKLREIVHEAVERIKEEYDIVDRPKGEWRDRTYGGRILHPWWESYECSQCEEWGAEAWNFCPHCGARMRGADDEAD